MVAATNIRKIPFKKIGWILIFSAYLFNCYGGKVGSAEITKIYFLLLSLTLLSFSISDMLSEKNWIYYSIIECCVYNVIDELSGRACVLDNFEIIGAVLIFSINFIYSKWYNKTT